MRCLTLSVIAITGFIILHGCKVQKHANTVVSDKDNPCVIQMVIQVGIEGTDADVAAVRGQVEPCFEQECFIPCENDSAKGCKVIMNVIVKRWDSVTLDEMESFHHVVMVDNDGLPSNAQIGEANGKNARGTWRRNEHHHTYCHEIMHFLGLEDKYCSRLFDAANNASITELVCVPPPDPNGNCCTPTATNTRCSTPCHGHENDLMGGLTPGLSCENIADVLSKTDFKQCPQACCESGTAFHRPPETAVGPAYLYFGDKDFKYGTFGGKLDYSYPLSSKIGVTIDAGAYTHTDKEDDFKQTNNLFTVGGGITYWPKLFGSDSKLDLSVHGMGGILHYRTKFTLGNLPSQESGETSLMLNFGTTLSYKLNRLFDLRIMQVDYVPTFFGDQTQHNYRISAGLSYKFDR